MISRDRTRDWQRLVGTRPPLVPRAHPVAELHVAAQRALEPGRRDAARCARAAAVAAANAVARADNAHQAAHAHAVGAYVARRVASPPTALRRHVRVRTLAAPATARITAAHERAQTDAFRAFERTRAVRGVRAQLATVATLTERVAWHVDAHSAPIDRLERAMDAVEVRVGGARAALERRARRAVQRRTHLRCGAIAVATCLFWTLLCL